MLALYLAIMVAAWLIEAADDNPSYHVHGSVAFVRTGERTPLIAPGPRVLSASGAQQMYTLGQNIRSRYVNEKDGPGGLGVQQILDLSPNILKQDQLLIQTLDTPYLFASAQAFMQGLYPPYSTNITQDEFPVGGYQYAQIEAVSQLDAKSVYIGGDQNCPVSQQDSAMYPTTEQFLETKASYKSLYQALDVDIFKGYLAQSEIDYFYAFEIYDYLSYAYEHDSDIHDMFSNDSSYTGVLDQLRYLADEEAWYKWGNTSASSSDSDDRAMAGKTLAALILGQFQQMVNKKGNTTNGDSHLLTLLFGEHEPFISLFSLMMADHLNEHFRSVPPFGSAMIFELFSTGSSVDFPAPEDLWINFYFHNGTAYDDSLQSYPIFGRGPSGTDIPWLDFEDMMSRIMTNVLSDWCSQCSSGALFCWGVDNSTINIMIEGQEKQRKVSPTVAGVIGAVVTLSVAGLLFALAMLVGGIRFHRVNRGKKSDLGGFKGSAKLASDADLNLAKNGVAPAGIVSFGNGTKKTAHERVGSWELRQKEFGKSGDIGDESRRESFDAIEAAMSRPVEPTERI